MFPYSVMRICGSCWRKDGTIMEKDKNGSQCKSELKHRWKNNAVWLMLPVRKILGECPKSRRFAMCRHELLKGHCNYKRWSGKACKFAHSQEEIEAWSWMLNNNVKKVKDLAKYCPTPTQTHEFTCQYCSVTCKNKSLLDEHCLTSQHISNVASDKEHQWNYRPPPWGTNGQFHLCQRHKEKKCHYSNVGVDGSGNYCIFAHSDAELDEWMERYRWRQMRKETAKQQHLYSYMEALLDEYKNAEFDHDVMCECVDGASIHCDSDAFFCSDDKNAAHVWKFQLTVSGMQLSRVALLLDDDRHHFFLSSTTSLSPNCQLASGTQFTNKTFRNVYEVNVNFTGGVFGLFRQWVIFDLGGRPVLMREVTAELGAQQKRERVKMLQEKLKFDRWTSDNRKIVQFPQPLSFDADSLNAQLLMKYPAPSRVDGVFDVQTVDVDLNRHNFVKQMHRLLHLEELTQAYIISGFNMRTTMRAVKSSTIQGGTFVIAPGDEMFGEVKLDEELNEDSDAGRLILWSVSTVLLCRVPASDNVVYEAKFAEAEMFKGLGKDCICLHLSKKCCTDLKITAGSELDVDIQFTMNRLHFCQMHYALDLLDNVGIIFPDISKVTNALQTSISTHSSSDICSSVLNEDQMKIVDYIRRQKQHTYIAPLVVFGAFGTGKTETLARSALSLVQMSKSDVRILICTHTNSAADEYIIRHFHKAVVSSNHNIKLLRIYDVERHVNTVNSIVQNYCLLASNRQQFVSPTCGDIVRHHIVVTTNVTSLLLSQLCAKGCFTHIFVDEAAQVLECQAIMPLSLAETSTCIVVTGDHLQMTQHVYSAEARELKMHHSIVERLIKHYSSYGNPASQLSVRLRRNYRSHPDILRFLSSVFYGGPDVLVSCTNEPVTAGKEVALNFFEALGREVQDDQSTSWYNVAEVDEVVERIAALCCGWPAEWGSFEPESILVTTPYTDQVQKIRCALRRKRIPGLNRVTVLRVHNLPGLEYRAVLISTVRSRHLTDRLDDESLSDDDGYNDSTDFGFLSQPKLLNTAMTRARSWLGVVGDPVALCSVGECSRLWTTYLKQCHDIGGIHPEDLTLDDIWLNVEAHAREVAQMANDITPQIGDLDKLNGTNFAEWSLDYQIEPDEIIRQLMKDALAETSSDDDSESETLGAQSVYFAEKDARALIICDEDSSDSTNVHNENNKVELLTGTGIMDMKTLLTHESNQVKCLKKFVEEQPELYKHCIFHVEHTKLFACPLDNSLTRIHISAKNRSCSFSGDHVVVRITSFQQETGEGDKKAWGTVVGVVKHMVDPKSRLFLCRVDEYSSGLMVPIDRTLPKIYNLVPKRRAEEDRSKVCVYVLSKSKRIKFERYEDVDSCSADSKLFVVQYLKWKDNCRYPLGIVVGSILPGISSDQAMHILDIGFCVPTVFQASTQQEVEALYPDRYTSFPPQALHGRSDFRQMLVFTIDGPQAVELDDALSLDVLPTGHLVRIHIADVSYFVSKFGNINHEAFARGTSFYATDYKSTPMLPPKLGTNLCSLLPGCDRLTLTVNVKVSSEFKILSTKVKRSVIRSRCKLTYADVENIITGVKCCLSYPDLDALQPTVLKLHTIACQLRRNRLGISCASLLAKNRDTFETPNANALVEEFMITANHAIAKYLLKVFPDCVPLRVQAEPGDMQLKNWIESFGDEQSNMLALSPLLAKFKPSCSCDGVCLCATQSCFKVEVLKSLWDTIVKDASGSRENMERICTLISNPDFHPQLAAAAGSFYKIQKRSVFVCSAEIKADERCHSSQNLSAYTHFTSPIRRYLDLVVHRLVVAAIDGQPCPYTSSEIMNICIRCTNALGQESAYEKASEIVSITEHLRNQPATVYAFVEKLTSTRIELHIPVLQSLLRDPLCIAFNNLNVADRPFSSDSSDVRLRWCQRIFELKPHKVPPRTHSKPVCLAIDQDVIKIPSNMWRLMLQSVLMRDSEIITRTVRVASSSLKSTPKTSGSFVKDVTSEGADTQFCDFSVEFHPSTVLQIQLSTALSRGMLQPCVQLLHLTPTVNICIEHNSNPALCFSKLVFHNSAKDRYVSIKQYQQLWLPVLRLESAVSALAGKSSAIVRNVKFKWKKTTDKQGYVGEFQVPAIFCMERQIFCTRNAKKKSKPGKSENANSHASPGYICIQYVNRSDVSFTQFLNGFSMLSCQSGDSDSVSWVGHCVVDGISTDSANAMNTVTVRLNHSSSKFPERLLADHSQLANVEWIPKNIPDQRMEDTIHGLHRASVLAQDIALGRNPRPLDEDYLQYVRPVCKKLRSIPGFRMPPNDVQYDAIQKAMFQPFTLIQGPPGTGKTVTAVRLAVLFHQLNKTLSSDYEADSVRPQVMICGPSNKSVDVIAGYLHRTQGKSLNIVRVCSDTLERGDFPKPGPPPLFQRRVKLNDGGCVPEVTLHHLIREGDEPQAANIRDVDKQIRHDASEINAEMLSQYLEDIHISEKEKLQDADIILCTCILSNVHRIIMNTNIVQLIVDECGMCKEVESIVPIVSSKARQVVLVGDHKQLEPVVLDQTAAKCGLTRSLFERYSHQAVMLTTQYRMHEAIAAFPSKQFYGGNLKIGREEQSSASVLNFWPGGGNRPLAFVNVVGQEQTLTVTTDEGSEQSKSNIDEATLAIRVVEYLLKKGVKQNEIAILSQYRAQCSAISRQLQHRPDVTVSTVISAQGSEWDYVILSTVRSMPREAIDSYPNIPWQRRHLGFITKEHQINVAITRSRKGLIIIGNQFLLECNELWKKLLTHYGAQRAIIDGASFDKVLGVSEAARKRR